MTKLVFSLVFINLSWFLKTNERRICFVCFCLTPCKRKKERGETDGRRNIYKRKKIKQKKKILLILNRNVCQVHLTSLVQSLPDKLYTDLSTVAEGLSTGHRQLLRLARALLLHPKVLVYEEPLSSLDLMWVISQLLTAFSTKEWQQGLYDAMLAYVCNRESLFFYHGTVVMKREWIVSQGKMRNSYRSVLFPKFLLL